MTKNIRKILKPVLMITLILSWLLSGWPGVKIGQNLYFPPKIRKSSATSPIPAYRSSGTFTAGIGSITPPYPVDMVANDVCLLAVSSENEAITLTTANGFAEVPTWSPQSAGTAATDPGSRLAVFWKRTVGGDSAPVVADSGNNTEGVIHCFSGVATSGNPWDTGAGGNDTAANDTTGNIPGSTTTVDNTLIVLINSTSYNGTSTTSFSGWTNADLANILERQDNSNTAGLGGGSGMATGEKASAGAYTTTTVTLAATSYKGAISLALRPPPLTNIGNGASEPSNVTIAPGAGITDLDNFTLQSDTGTSDTVTAAVVTLGPASAFDNIAQVDITDNTNVAKCTAVAPSSNTVTFSTCTIPVTTTLTTYKVRVTPKSHANMPAPSVGQSYATTGTVTSFTSTNAQAGTDSGSATVTIDNLSPNGATATSGSAGNTAVTLNWTSSSSTDFDTTNGSVILRWASGTAGSEVPAEGNSSYTAGNTISTATVACVISSATSTALSKVDGTGGSAGCTTAALTNGQAYTYKAFQRDTNGNYDAGVSIGTFTPSGGPPSCSSQASANWSAVGTWTAGCSGGNGQPIAGDIATISAGNTVTVDGAQAASTVTINGTGTLTFASASSLTLGGTSGTILTNSGTLTTVSNSTVIFNGATAPTALLSGSFTGANSFYNLTLSPTIAGSISYNMGAAFNAGGDFMINPTAASTYLLTVNLGGNSTVTGTTTLSGTTSGTSKLDATASHYTFGTGKMSIGAPGTLVDNTVVITVSGTGSTTWVNSGTYTATGTVTFTGTAPEIGASNFNNLIINTTGSNIALLTGNATVAGDLTVTSGVLNLSTFTANRGTSGGVMTVSNGATLKIAGTNTIPSSYTTHTIGATSTIEYAGGAQSVATLNNAGSTYGNLTISAASTKTLAGAITVTTALNISAGTLDDNGSQITSTGTLNLTGGTFKLGSAGIATTFPAFTAGKNISGGTTVEYASGVAQTVSTAPGYSLLTFSGAGQKNVATGTLTVGSNFSTSGGLTAFSTNNAAAGITGDVLGTGNITSGTGDLTIGGSWSNTGTFTGDATGKVIMTGTGKGITGDTSAGIAFTNLTINGTVTNNNTYASSGITVSLALAGSGTLTQGANSVLTINGTSSGLTLNASSNTNTVQYTKAGDQTVLAIVYSTLILGGSGIKTFAGSSSVTASSTVASGTTLDPTSLYTFTGTGVANTLSVTGTIKVYASTFAGTYIGFETRTLNSGSTVEYAASGSQTVDNTLTYYNLIISGGASNTKTLGGVTTVNTDVTIAASTILSTSISNYNMSVGGNWNNNGGTFTYGTGTVTFNGSGAQSIQGSAAGQTFNNLTIAKTAGQLLNTAGSTTTLSVQDFTQTTGNFTAPATMNINGNVTLSAGTYTAGTNTNLTGNWSNPGGNFVAGTGTVTLNGADSSTQAISGNTTFNNLYASTAGNTAGRTVQYAGLSTTTVGGTWTMNGASGKVLTLQSSDTNNWTITPTASSVDYVYLSRSTNTVGTICATHSTGDANNSGYTITADASCGGSPPAGVNSVFKGMNFKGIILK